MTTTEPASAPAHRPMLAAARAEALFASPLSADTEYDTVDLRFAIRTAISQYGVRGCVEVMACEFGNHPAEAVRRMQWARNAVAPLCRP